MLMDVLGQPGDLLAAAGVVAGVFLLVVKWTQYWFPTELSAVEHIDDDAPVRRFAPSSAIGTSCSSSGSRCSRRSRASGSTSSCTTALRGATPTVTFADFVSRFTAIAYGSDVLFLVVLAGILLHRFGLRYGLTANPARC